MADYRINRTPSCRSPKRNRRVHLEGPAVQGLAGETIASALFANGVRIFGHHPKDGAPQGIFCANGQCAQCTVIADGLPVKSCMALVRPGMRVEPLDGLPELPDVARRRARLRDIPRRSTCECLIIGGGPAGLSAAIELGQRGRPDAAWSTTSTAWAASWCCRPTASSARSTPATPGRAASTSPPAWSARCARIENGARLAEHHGRWPCSATGRWASCAMARYVLVQPQVLLVATGAREKSLTFQGNTLPGVYGAGAFQTLVNRDLVRPSERLFIVGGGNVGLIAGYHALQAGIEVVGLVRGAAGVRRLQGAQGQAGAHGRADLHLAHRPQRQRRRGREIGHHRRRSTRRGSRSRAPSSPLPATRVLIAVGLDPVDEFYRKAKEFGLPAFAAGDAEEIAEASAAMFSGKIQGLEIAHALGRDVGEIPPDWYRTAEILKSRPGATVAEELPPVDERRVPGLPLHPGDPLQPVHLGLPAGAIFIDEDDIRACRPSSAISASAARSASPSAPAWPSRWSTTARDAEYATVTIPYEFTAKSIKEGDVVTVLDTEGGVLGNVEVTRVREPRPPTTP